MGRELTVVFFENYFVCGSLNDKNSWENLRANDNEQELLYFYVEGNKIRNDEFAKEKYDTGDTNAYGDFYNLILQSGKTFKLFDRDQKIISLLRDVLENVKTAFLKKFNADENSKIPIHLCFIPGISEDVKSRIKNYFQENEFNIIKEAGYLETFIAVLKEKDILAVKQNFCIIEPWFGNLFFHYIEYNKNIINHSSEKVPGKGADYNIANLAKLLVEKAAKIRSSSILYDKERLEKEIKSFYKRAAAEINNFIHGVLEIKVELSDYSSARVVIEQNELVRMSQDSFDFISDKFNAFIVKNNGKEKIDKIFLNGKSLSENMFAKFQKIYPGKIIMPYDNFSDLLSQAVYKVSFSLTQEPEPVIKAEPVPVYKDTVTKKTEPEPITYSAPPQEVKEHSGQKPKPEIVIKPQKPTTGTGRKKIVTLLVILFALAGGGYYYLTKNNQKEFFVNSYTGQIKGKQVRLSLVRRRFVLTGDYTNPNTGKISRFTGNVDSKGNFSLHDDAKPMNTLVGKLDKKYISGQWSTYGSYKSYSFYLTFTGGY